MDIDEELLGAAVEFAGTASRLAAECFLQGAPASTKADGSAVTTADIEVEDLLRSLIAARFPADGVVGEERGESAGTSGRRWILDPVNGTAAFMLRIPMFNVLVAVEDEDGSAVSVISYPMSQELYYAGRGCGCWHQVGDRAPRRITVSGIRQLRGAAVEMVNPATWTADRCHDHCRFPDGL